MLGTQAKNYTSTRLFTQSSNNSCYFNTKRNNYIKSKRDTLASKQEIQKFGITYTTELDELQISNHQSTTDTYKESTYKKQKN